MRSPAERAPRHRDRSPRRVSILGVTGSVGVSAADVISQRRDAFEVEAVTAQSRVEELAQAARRLGARIAVIGDETRLGDLAAALAGSGIEAAAGEAAIVEAAGRPVDIVVAAVVGAAGLAPTLAAVRAGADVALANKECLVCAGELFIETARRAGVRILPVDSEHNAIFQALEADNCAAVEKITLTASGGPFRNWPLEAMRKADVADALKHPRWSMGPKITIDSATMMNKGLEVIEAHHLFAVEPERLEVLVHPQSVVHGLVTYADGSVVAQLGAADMRIPIAHCLAWPARAAVATPRLDLAAVGELTFEKPDLQRFPALGLARSALESGSWAANILNAANEVAVDSFLAGELAFLDIAAVVADALARAAGTLGGAPVGSVESALAMDAEGRRLAREETGRRRRQRTG